MVRSDIEAQLNDYRGVLGWTDWNIEIPLYIKEHTIPMRKQKFTEINTVSVVDPGSGAEVGTSMLFFGAPDLLQVNLSGWIITPYHSQRWWPTDRFGNNLNVGNVTYPEIISMFIQGQMTPNAAGTLKRKDPDYYITPYGQKYIGPVIAQWDPQFTTIPAKQTFSMTLNLES